MNKLEIHHFESTDSVLDRLKEYATLGKNCLCIADEQTSGRGTKGRSFFSGKGCGAYFGLLYFPSFDQRLYHLVTPAAAVSVSTASDELCGIKTEIKWVNDVYYSGKKVCGILTESGENDFGKYLIIGIGINLSEPKCGYPEDIKNKAGFLPGNIDRDKIVNAVADKLIDYLDNIDKRTFVDAYVKKNYLLYKKVAFVSGNISGKGIVRGFDDELRIVILTENGKITLGSGEVTLDENN